MTKLSEKTVQELRDILRGEYGKEVSFDEAETLARDLVGYFDLLAEIYHREQIEDPAVPAENP